MLKNKESRMFISMGEKEMDIDMNFSWYCGFNRLPVKKYEMNTNMDSSWYCRPLNNCRSINQKFQLKVPMQG